MELAAALLDLALRLNVGRKRWRNRGGQIVIAAGLGVLKSFTEFALCSAPSSNSERNSGRIDLAIA
jgi:hypothetical protein